MVPDTSTSYSFERVIESTSRTRQPGRTDAKCQIQRSQARRGLFFSPYYVLRCPLHTAFAACCFWLLGPPPSHNLRGHTAQSGPDKLSQAFTKTCHRRTALQCCADRPPVKTVRTTCFYHFASAQNSRKMPHSCQDMRLLSAANVSHMQGFYAILGEISRDCDCGTSGVGIWQQIQGPPTLEGLNES